MSKKTYLLLFSLTILVISTIFRNTLFEGESTLYAQISKQITNTGDFINLLAAGKNWFIKPHFSFWINSFFMTIFGKNDFAYRIASIIFLGIGIGYTYHLASILYNKNIAYLSTIILASSTAISIGLSEAQTGCILLGLCTGAIFHFYILTQKEEKMLDLILGLIFSGIAILIEGPLLLLVIILPLFIHFYFINNLKKIYIQKISLKMVLTALLIIILCLTPELYALYIQLDSTFEKIFLNTAIGNLGSGIIYFLFAYPLSIFTGETTLSNRYDYFFIVHTLLWSFAPWTAVGIWALIKKIKKILQNKEIVEYITIGGFLINYFIISIFTLYQYELIILGFPYLSILVAKWFEEYEQKNELKKDIKYTISVYIYPVILIIFIIFIEFVFQTQYPLLAIFMITVFLIISIFLYFYETKYTHFINNLLAILFFFIYVNLSFFPTYQNNYQAGKKAANYCKEFYQKNIILTTETEQSFPYYFDKEVVKISTFEEVEAIIFNQGEEAIILYTDFNFLLKLRNNDIFYTLIKSYLDHEGSPFDLPFYQRDTRYNYLNMKYLIELD